MAGYERHLKELTDLGAGIVAGSVDNLANAAEVAAELSFPIAFGMTRAMAESIGAFWEERRSIIQPSEFLLDAKGGIMNATYSAGPLGRIDAAEAVRYIASREKQRRTA